MSDGFDLKGFIDHSHSLDLSVSPVAGRRAASPARSVLQQQSRVS